MPEREKEEERKKGIPEQEIRRHLLLRRIGVHGSSNNSRRDASALVKLASSFAFLLSGASSGSVVSISSVPSTFSDGVSFSSSPTFSPSSSSSSEENGSGSMNLARCSSTELNG